MSRSLFDGPSVAPEKPARPEFNHQRGALPNSSQLDLGAVNLRVYPVRSKSFSTDDSEGMEIGWYWAIGAHSRGPYETEEQAKIKGMVGSFEALSSACDMLQPYYERYR